MFTPAAALVFKSALYDPAKRIDDTGNAMKVAGHPQQMVDTLLAVVKAQLARTPEIYKSGFADSFDAAASRINATDVAPFFGPDGTSFNPFTGWSAQSFKDIFVPAPEMHPGSDGAAVKISIPALLRALQLRGHAPAQSGVWT